MNIEIRCKGHCEQLSRPCEPYYTTFGHIKIQRNKSMTLGIK